MPRPCRCAVCVTAGATDAAVFEALRAGGMDPDRAAALAAVAMAAARDAVRGELLGGEGDVDVDARPIVH